MSEIKKDAEFWQRQTNILRAPKADIHTRVALVVAERRITEKQLQKFYKTGRRGKRFFDYFVFAQKQQISIEWIMDILATRQHRVRSNPAASQMGMQHETPAPIGQDAQPAADRRARKAAEAMKQEGRGSRSAPLSLSLSSKSAPIHASRFSGNGINGQAN